jgi:endonuclease/exonuclease/phosphatase family metal-dependent hydrolase
VSPRSASLLASYTGWQTRDRGVADNAASHPGTAAVVDVRSDRGDQVVLISAYGLIDGGSSHTTLHRLLSDLEPLLDSSQAQRVLLGGDLNSGDQPYDDTLPHHELLWRRIELLGFRNVVAQFATDPLAGCSCHKGDACRHVRTQKYRPNSSNPWQADYILAMTELDITGCRVLNEILDDDWVSDHCPIVAEISF